MLKSIKYPLKLAIIIFLFSAIKNFSQTNSYLQKSS